MSNSVETQVVRMNWKNIAWHILVVSCAMCLPLGCARTTSPAPISAIGTSTYPPSTITTTPITLTPSITPSSTSTPTPKPTATLTPTITPTRLPTLPRPEAEEKVMELYRTNGRCRLPCWWGITPGKTSSNDARKILGPLALGKTFHSAENWEYFDVGLPAPKDVYETFFQEVYISIDGIVDSIVIYETFPSPFYNTISNFLSSVGPPEEVWVSASLGLYEDMHPFRVQLFYPHRGILVSFSDNANLVGNKLESCSQGDDGGTLFIWASGADKTFENWRYITRWGSYNALYLPLDAATGMDVETFYETFKKPTNQVCLRTTIDIWPTPGAVARDWPTITIQPTATTQLQ
jgi:hypothetical protein